MTISRLKPVTPEMLGDTVNLIVTRITVPSEYKLKATYAEEEGYIGCETITLPTPRWLLVIPETQTGAIAALTRMLIALVTIKRGHSF